MFLLQINSMLRKAISVESITNKLVASFNVMIGNNEEVRAEIEEIIGQRHSYDVAFAGISFHHMLEYTPELKRFPFYRACLHLVRKEDRKIVAWYKLEFDGNNEVIDEYFYFTS